MRQADDTDAAMNPRQALGNSEPGGREPSRPEAGGRSARALGTLSLATMFVIGTDTFLVSPLLPTLRRTFAVDVPASAWLVSAYAIGYIVSALIAGPISDRVDRRRMLIAGMTAFTVATAACGLAWGYWPMIALRAVAGATAALASPQIWASIPQLVSGATMMRTMGLATAGLSVAQVAGIPLGAMLAAISWRAAFWFVGAAGAAVTTLLAARFPRVPAPARPMGRSTPRSGYAAVFASRTMTLGLLAYLVFQTGTFAAFSFFGTWFDRDFHLDTTGIGLVMIAIGVGQACGSLFGHRVTDRLGRARSLWIGLVAMAAGYGAVAFVGELVAAVALLTFIQLVAGALFPVLMATLQQHAGSVRGTMSSLANVAMYAGTTIGAALAGPIFVATPGFRGVATLVVAADLVALAGFALAGALQSEHGPDA